MKIKENEMRIGIMVHDPIHNKQDILLTKEMLIAFLEDWKDELIGIPITHDILINKFKFERYDDVRVNEYEYYERYVLKNVVCGTSNFEVHVIYSNYGGQKIQFFNIFIVCFLLFIEL